jgi:hypothetical protein
MPPLSVWPGLLPLARHYSSRKYNAIDCLSFRINVTPLGKDCCLIVNSFENNYRAKKTCERCRGRGEHKEEGDKETKGDRATRRQGNGDISTF